MRVRWWWAIPLVVASVGCSAALTPVAPEQASALKEAQRIADVVTNAYGVPRVRVYATSTLASGVAGGYLYRQDWLFIDSRHLSADAFLVVLSHELGHATLGHRPIDREQPAEIAAKEAAANRRGVEIMIRFMGLTELQALEHYAAYFIRANNARGGRGVQIPIGHKMPCMQLRELWSSFDQTPPDCQDDTSPPKITTDGSTG